MASVIQQLTDKTGTNSIYPITVMNAIYDNDGATRVNIGELIGTLTSDLKTTTSTANTNKTNIATLASDINNANVLSILNNGFPTQTKTFSDDGTTITATSGDSDTLGWTLTKVFTDSFLTCTTTLKDAGENIKATLIKQFSADGKTISTVYNYEG